MAARAGAVIADPEFVQFHPTAHRRRPRPGAARHRSAARRGRDADQRRGRALHAARSTPLAELAPRDVVARGVFAEIAAGRGAFLDCRDGDRREVRRAFPDRLRGCMAAGIDPAQRADPGRAGRALPHGRRRRRTRDGRTSLDGLWAGGEVASTGAHGANRLASNSLLEAVVFAARIAEDIDRPSIAAPARLPAAPHDTRNSAMPAARGSKPAARLMTAHVGVIRDGERPGATRCGRSRRSSATAAQRRAAQHGDDGAADRRRGWSRRESRGGHYRSTIRPSRPGAGAPHHDDADAARDIAASRAERAAVPSPQPMTA